MVAAFADGDVTEAHVNPADYRVGLGRRSRGKVDTGHRLEPGRVEMFLNAVADCLGATLGADSPRDPRPPRRA